MCAVVAVLPPNPRIGHSSHSKDADQNIGNWDIVAVAGKAVERRLLVEADVRAFVRAISPKGPEADGQMLSSATKKDG